jgi:hypothetical protein
MTNRRQFLVHAASTGLLAAMPVDRALLPHAGERADPTPFAADDTDLTWVSRLRGKSRAVFDSPQVSEGGALFRAALWRQQVNKALGIPLEDVTPVVVFRHEGIVLAMNDEYWDHMGTGKDVKLKDEKTHKWTRVNPISGCALDAPADLKDFTIPAFIKNGGIVLACGLAFQEIVHSFVDKDKVPQDEAKTRAMAHLIPGVIIQPSGFFAVLKAQDEGCKYMMGS